MLAESEIKNKAGLTPLESAKKDGKTDCAKILENYQQALIQVNKMVGQNDLSGVIKAAEPFMAEMRKTGKTELMWSVLIK